MSNSGPLIGAIDQGTSSTRFFVFAANSGQVITSHQVELKKLCPYEGWYELDAKKIIDTVNETIKTAVKKLGELRTDGPEIKCIGISNQRETTVVWDKHTGQPLYNAIVWLDNRTKDLVDAILDSLPGRDINHFKRKTGLPISTYFSALKIKWLIDNVAEVRAAIKSDRLMFGTIDTWVMWNLTGNHYTDVTNASRTFLMDIETLEWDKSLCEFFNIPMKILPQIKSCSDDFGEIKEGPLKGVRISGVIGDQSAALVGQHCFSVGETKATYGTGCFLMQNIGPGPLYDALRGTPKVAKQSLLITVAYKFGTSPVCYAIEGSIAIAGAAITWLRDNLEIIENYKQVEQLAREAETSGGVFFVPAFQGLYAPYWDPRATGLLIGLSQFTRKHHVVRATLEGIAFETVDILSIMRRDSPKVNVDGGMSNNNLLCQLLADLTGCDIVRPAHTETTGLGAAIVAGQAMNLWDISSLINVNEEEASSGRQRRGSFIGYITESISQRFAEEEQKSSNVNLPQGAHVFKSNIDESLREDKIATWKSAVSRCRNWTTIKKEELKREYFLRLSTLPIGFYLILSFGTLILSSYF